MTMSLVSHGLTMLCIGEYAFKIDSFISPKSSRAMSDKVVILTTDCNCLSETQVHEDLASFEMSVR